MVNISLQEEGSFVIVDDSFDTVAFLVKAENLDSSCMPEEYFNYLDRLCKKNDVVKSIKKYYTADLSKGNTVEELSNNDLVLFASVLIKFSAFYKDPKFINSVFKLIDRISLGPAGIKQQEVAMLRSKALKVLDAL